MMEELPVSSIAAYLNYFPGTQSVMVLASVIEGNTEAQFWYSPQPDHNTVCLLWDKGNNVFYLPLAFFIARLPARFKTLALKLVVIPFWTNLLIRTYAWQILFAPESWLTQAVHLLGFGTAGEALYPSTFAVVVGMVCDFLPFMVLPLYASVEKIDWTLAEAAMDLGANRRNVFRHALLPQIRPGLIAGFVLVFPPATGQFVIP